MGCADGAVAARRTHATRRWRPAPTGVREENPAAEREEMARIQRRPPPSRGARGLLASWYRVGALCMLLYAGVVAYIFRNLLGPYTGTSVTSFSPASLADRTFPLPIDRKGVRDPRNDASTVGLVDAAHAASVAALERELQQEADGAYAAFRSCRWRAGGLYANDDACPSGPVLYVNPHTEPRILCGETVAPHGRLLRQEACAEPPRLFPVIPDITARGLPPVVTCFDSCDHHGGSPFSDCDIPCMEAGSPGLLGSRHIAGTDWKIKFSMEGPQYYNDLFIKKDAYRSNHFYSTTSYDSEIPLPYFSWAEYDIRAPPVRYDDAIKGAVFLARNCNSRNHREDIIRQLEDSAFRVDSLSSCLHNAAPPPGIDLSNKLEVMRHYLFYLAFENQNETDYITEKFWGPLAAGTVPVYLGAPNIKDHAPNESAVFVADFTSVADLAAHLQEVAADRTRYERYHAWRTSPLPPHFHARYDFTHTHSTCRTCRWAHARLYGLGWHHRNQSLVALRLPRKVCLDERGLVAKPFQESWWSGGSKVMQAVSGGDVLSSNQLPWSGSTQQIGDSSLWRTLYEQDGVIDFYVESPVTGDDDHRLRLNWPLESTNSFAIIEEGHGRLQDQNSRVTILVRPKLGVDFQHSGQGLIDILIPSNQLPLKIRFIVEDIDSLHEGADQVENHFGKRMIEDFYNPVETFAKI